MTPEAAKSLADFFLPQIGYELGITRKVIAAMPADKADYKPSEKCMSALELAGHVAAAEAFFLNAIINSTFEWKQPELKSKEDVIAYLDQTVQPLIGQVAALPPEKFAAPITFAGMTEPAVTYMCFHLKHAIHHRGQLSAYLRPMGGKVPSIYGPSADEPGQATA